MQSSPLEVCALSSSLPFTYNLEAAHQRVHDKPKLDRVEVTPNATHGIAISSILRRSSRLVFTLQNVAHSKASASLPTSARRKPSGSRRRREERRLPSMSANLDGFVERRSPFLGGSPAPLAKRGLFD